MNNRISIDYTITNDYTSLNSPAFVNVIKLYNLILLPKNDKYNIKLSDSINVLDKTTNSILKQKVVLSIGNIILNNILYTYFYIANGITYQDHEYALILNGEYIDLQTNTHSDSAKLLLGSIVLDNNYNYMFDTNIPLIANIDNNFIKFNITNIVNKYNFYQPLVNNTILFLLDTTNFEILSALNNKNNTILIRPLYYKDFPLGSLYLKLSNYNGVSNSESPEFKIFINNKSYYINGNSLNIKNLTSNNYTIKIIDRFGLLNIDYLNGQLYNGNEFIINIPLVKDNYKLDKIALPIPREYYPPKQGFSHLMINLEHNRSFELLGPNNLQRFYNNGKQSLYNIISGNYVIVYNDKLQSFYVPPNEIVEIP